MEKKMQFDKKEFAFTMHLVHHFRRIAFSVPRLLLLVAGIVVVSGCAFSSKAPRESFVLLNIDANEDINPDINNRPSPVELHVYFLKNSDVFLEQDYYSLVEDPERLLRQDLISKEGVIIMPGVKEHKAFNVQADYEYVGVVASFRDFEGSGWRDVIKRPEAGALAGIWPEPLKVGRSGWLLYLDIQEKEVRIRAR